MVGSKNMYRSGLSGFLVVALGLGVASDARAQESSIRWQSRLNNIWSRIIKDDEDKERPWGSRGDMCAIAPTNPNAGTPIIWHDQPVIVWQAGTVAKVSLQNNFDETLWEYVPSADETHVVYDGEPLQPGQTYTLALHNIASLGPTLIPDFQVMHPIFRSLVGNGLENSFMPNEFTVSNEEWMAIHQADYFSKRELSFDAIQSLFSVSDPSSELLAIQEQVIEEACD